MNNEKFFLASNIKYLRTLNHKTQQDVAKYCEKTNTAISNWEKGIREPDAVDLAKLSNYFNVSVDDLLLKDLRFEKVELNELSSDNVEKNIFDKIHTNKPIEISQDGYVIIPCNIKNLKKGDIIRKSELTDFMKKLDDDIILITHHNPIIEELNERFNNYINKKNELENLLLEHKINLTQLIEEQRKLNEELSLIDKQIEILENKLNSELSNNKNE